MLPLVMIFGIFLTIKLKFPQITKLIKSFKIFWDSLFENKDKRIKRGVSPLSAFFTSIGGCIGIANLVGVCAAIKIGGPGAIFWMWVAAFLGMSIKYAEVYLGIKFRFKNDLGGYDGGPMFYLKKAFKSNVLPIIIAILLAIYGTEIYMFNVMVEAMHTNWHLHKFLAIALLLIAIIYASSGGISRVGKICSFIIPIFLILFVFMGGYVIYKNSHNIFNTFIKIFYCAFNGHAAVGGFAGSTIVYTMSQGMARGCYSGDIGIGYAAIVHAESSEVEPEKQSNLAILGIFLDTFIICTITALIVLVTETWHIEKISETFMVQFALERYFPHMNIFMPIFILILGYSSMIAFFSVGLKCAKFISPKWGKAFYYVYAVVSLVSFSFIKAEYVFDIMSLCGAILLILNLFGIYKLRKEVS